MGRQVRRVPLDFDWPLNKPWSGYISPEWRPCPGECENGSTVESAWVEATVHLILTMAHQSRRGYPPIHPWLERLAYHPDRAPGPKIVELTTGLAGRSPSPLGHDSCDRWEATKKIFVAAGLKEDWGTCPVCHGHAIHPDDFQLSECWVQTDPPIGDGWQLWETVSAGSPITPVFKTPEELARHLTNGGGWTSLDGGQTYERWLKFVTGPGWAPSMMSTPDGRIVDGVTAVVERDLE